MKHRQGCSKLGYTEASPSTATIRSRAPPSIISSSSSASSNAQSAKSRSPRDKPDSPHVMIKVNSTIPNVIPMENHKLFEISCNLFKPNCDNFAYRKHIGGKKINAYLFLWKKFEKIS